MSAFYAVSSFVSGVLVPYVPVLLTGKGLDGSEIAVVLALPHLMRMLTMPVLSGLSDRSDDRRQVMFGLIAITLAVAVLFTMSHNDILTIATGALVLVLSYCITPLADAIAVLMERHGLGDYGRMRLWASATYVLGNLVGGLALSHGGVSSVYALTLFGFFIAAVSSFVLPPPPARMGASPGPVLAVLRRPAFLAVLLGHAINQGGHAALMGYGTLAWSARGYSGSVIGVFWAVGVMAEIMLFASAARFPQWLSPLALMALGALIGATRWLLFTVETSLVATLLVQAMHAGSFALAHIGLMRFMRATVPAERSASAQGTFVIFNGLSMALGTAISGRLWPVMGVNAFLAMSLFCLTGFAILVAAWPRARRLPVADRGLVAG